jgi:hypothetical protein
MRSSQKNPSQKRAGGVTQGVGPEFKPHYNQKKKKERVERFSIHLEHGKEWKGDESEWGRKRLFSLLSKTVVHQGSAWSQAWDSLQSANTDCADL